MQKRKDSPGNGSDSSGSLNNAPMVHNKVQTNQVRQASPDSADDPPETPTPFTKRKLGAQMSLNMPLKSGSNRVESSESEGEPPETPVPGKKNKLSMNLSSAIKEASPDSAGEPPETPTPTPGVRTKLGGALSLSSNQKIRPLETVSP